MVSTAAIGRVSAIGVAWLALYFDTLRRLASDWRVDENYSHGFLIPAIGAYAIWAERKTLAATPRAPRFWLGAGVTFFSVLMLLAGIAGAELFLTRLSLILSFVGIVLYFCGMGWLRRLAFPIGLWLLAIPIPNMIFLRIALPLQLIASDLAARAIKLLGIPALREGNLIELAQMKLQVVEACSGIRSLVSLFTLAVVYLYFSDGRWWKRIAILLAVVPLAIFANAVRVAGTGVMAHHYGIRAAEGFLHGFSGWLVFLAAIVLLAGFAALLDRMEGLFA